jgi:hypothetical protein
MDTKHFRPRLISPRPSFAQDMTEAGGVYGVAISELADGVDPRSLSTTDPAIRANVGSSCEVYPMLTAVVRK